MEGMDMSKLFQQVGQMQQQMEQAQQELANETVEATAGGGMVTVVANGAGEIKQIKIDPKAIDRELTWAQDLGFNSVRVFLHDLLWQQDAKGFAKRIDQFLSIANKHRIGVIFVPFVVKKESL